jgi:hypothetical protein
MVASSSPNQARSTMKSADHIEAAINELIAARLFDEAAWLSQKLPARRQRRMIRALVAAI